MKKFIIISFTALAIGGCSMFKSMVTSEDTTKEKKKKAGTEVVAPATNQDSLAAQEIKVKVTPSPLMASGDSIKVDYEFFIPKNRFEPGIKLEVIPALLYATDTIIGRGYILQDETISPNKGIIMKPNSDGIYKGSYVFPYTKENFKNAEFYLVLLSVKMKKNTFGESDISTKVDTLYSSKGLSVIDRLLLVDELFMVAKEDSKIDTAKITAMQYAKGDSSKVRIDSIINDMNNDYIRAIADNNIAIVAYQNGDVSRAKTKLNDAIKEDATLFEPRFNLALIAIDQNEYQLAREQLKALLDIPTKETIHVTLYDYINGKYYVKNSSFSGFNKALIEILMQDLKAAEQTVEPMKGAHGDMLKLIIYARNKDTAKIDTILYQSKTILEKQKGYDIVENEISIYK